MTGSRVKRGDEYQIVEFDIPVSMVDRGKWSRISDGYYDGTPDFDSRSLARNQQDSGDWSFDHDNS